MLFQNQNDFRDTQVPALRRGKTSGLGAGYAELFKRWEELNSRYLYMVDDEFYVQSFADFLQDEVKKKIYELTDSKKLRQLAARGEVLLASEDGGETFDTLLPITEVKKKLKAMDYLLLTPTLHSAVLDLREVVDQQIAIHAARQLRRSGFEVQSAEIDDDHKITINVTPRSGIVRVEIDTNQPVTKPLEYVFVDKDGGQRKMTESQMPETYGQAQQDPELAMPDRAAITATTAVGVAAKASPAGAINAANAALAGISSVEAVSRVEDAAQASLERGQEFAFQKVQDITNVMQSKAETEARTERNKAKNQREFQLQKQIKEGYEKSLDNYAKKKRDEENVLATQAQGEQKSGASSLIKKVAIGAGTTGLFTAGGGIATVLINTAIS